jgi:hypothetical protein
MAALRLPELLPFSASWPMAVFHLPGEAERWVKENLLYDERIRSYVWGVTKE